MWVSDCTKLQVVLHCKGSGEGESLSSQGAGLESQRGRLEQGVLGADQRARAWPRQEGRG